MVETSEQTAGLEVAKNKQDVTTPDMTDGQKSEQTIRLEVLKKQQDFTAQVMSDGQKLPAEMVSAAETKLARFNKVKNEIKVDLASVKQILQGVREKITKNTLTKEQPDGFFTQKK